MIEPGRIRTCNLWIRSPTRYPLRHRSKLEGMYEPLAYSLEMQNTGN